MAPRLPLILAMSALWPVFELQAGASSLPLAGGHRLEFDTPPGWTEKRDILGLPLMILGPTNPTGRVAFTMSAAASYEKEINFEESSYQRGRNAWLQKRNGRLLKFLPLETVTVGQGLQTKSVGMRYKIGDEVFEERSWYLVCGQNLANLKAVIPSNVERSGHSGVEVILENLACR